MSAEHSEHIQNCPFCEKAESGLHDADVIYTDERYYAKQDRDPLTEGHFLVIPRRHASELSELEDQSEFFNLAIHLAEEVTEGLGAPAYTLKVNNRLYRLDDDPNHVGHVHMHVIPQYKE